VFRIFALPSFPALSGSTVLMLVVSGLSALPIVAPGRFRCAAQPAATQPAAQPAASIAPSVPQRPTDLNAQADRLLSQQAARHLTRVALLDLRAATPPNPSDYEFAALLLELAGDLDPADASIVRYRAEAAFNAGDTPGVMTATKVILELDPADTVALLRLITARINQIQTVEARLAAFEGFLGPKGSTLDASVRSRLALDAALLCRERSDEEGFVHFLRQSAQLDSTNKDAALLVLQHYSQHHDNPLGRLELLANLLYSDPIDPGVHRMIRDELIDASAFEAALRFHSSSERISALAREQPSASEFVESMCMNWRSEGPRATFDAINRSLISDRDTVASELARMDPVLQETARKPEDVRLAFEYEEIRLGTALILEDRAAIDIALADMAATVTDTIATLGDPTKRNPELGEAQAREISGLSLIGLQMWRLFANRDLDKVEIDLPRVVAAAPDDNVFVQSLLLWHSVRTADAPATRGLLASAPENVWTILARATFEQEQGNAQAAAAAFIAASDFAPLQVPGVLGWALAEKALPGVTLPTLLTTSLTDYAGTIPKWIDDMVEKPRLTQTLAVTLAPVNAEAAEHTFATLTLRNVSTIPLGVGSDRIMNSRMLFAPSLERKDGNAAAAEPEFMEINRRLRLMPGESLSTRLWPDVGLTGLLAEVACASPTRLRWRVLQGFEAAVGRSKQRGPGCQEAGTATVTRRPTTEAWLTAPELATVISASSDDRWPTVLYAARAGLLGPVDDRRLASDNHTIVAAIAAKFPSLSPVLRQLTLAIIPPEALSADTAAFDDALAAEADPAVLAVAVATRCDKVDHPVLLRAAQSADPRLVRLAAIQRARLGAATPTYASLGFGAKALTPTR